MSTPSEMPVYATVVFAQNKPGAILSIPPLEAPTSFLMRSRRFFTAEGREIVISDPRVFERVLQSFDNDAGSVFVVETGPLGFVADYPITKVGES